MKVFSVEITDSALSDMDEIYRYIRDVLRSPSAAANQYDGIAAEILSLDTMPERFMIPASPFFRAAGLHRMLVNNYSVFYLIQGDKVVVTDVLYSSSDIVSRLAEKHLET